MTRLAFLLLVVVGCGKKEPGTVSEGSGSSGSGSAVAVAPADASLVDAAPPADAIAAADAAPAAIVDAAAPAKLGAPVPLKRAFDGLVVRPFDDWKVAQKLDDVTWSSSCCIHEIHLRPVKAKLRTIDDLRAEIGSIDQLLTTQLDDVLEQHDVDGGWWAVIKGPSLTIPGDTNTVALRVVHLKNTTFVCSVLTATGAAGRDVRPDEVVTACETLRPK